MSHKSLLETLAVVQGLAPAADRYNTNPTGDYVTLAEYDGFLAIVQHGAGALGTAVVTVNAAEDNAGTNAEAIAFRYRTSAATAASLTAVAWATASGFTIAAGADQLALIEVNGDDLPEGKPWVSVTVTEGVNNPVDGAVLYALHGGRYNSADAPDVV